MKEFMFDAYICVEAKSQDEAVKLILEHGLKADIAIALFSEGAFRGAGFRKEETCETPRPH